MAFQWHQTDWWLGSFARLEFAGTPREYFSSAPGPDHELVSVTIMAAKATLNALLAEVERTGASVAITSVSAR